MTSVAISAFDGPIRLGQRVAYRFVDTFVHGTVDVVRLGGESGREPVIDIRFDVPLPCGDRDIYTAACCALSDVHVVPDDAVLLTGAEAEAYEHIKGLANQLRDHTGSPTRSALNALENLIATTIASAP